MLDDGVAKRLYKRVQKVGFTEGTENSPFRQVIVNLSAHMPETDLSTWYYIVV